jgi:hypothetical protein
VFVAFVIVIVLVLGVSMWHRIKHPEDVLDPGESPADYLRRVHGPPPTKRERHRARWALIACAVFAVLLTVVISSLPDDGGDCNTEGRCFHWTVDQP